MALQINDVAPNFEADTTEGRIKFHEWMGNSWAVLFSHPKDFTPVCTTELGYMAKLKPEFDKRNVKIIGLSVDPVDKHSKWSADIKETQGYAPNYPMIGDPDLSVAKSWGMLPATLIGEAADRTAADNQTVRNVFVVGPDKKIKLVLIYPMTTGRNFDEVLRVIDSLQLTAKHKVATELETGRGRHHRRLRLRRGREEGLPGRLEVAEAVHPDRSATQVGAKFERAECGGERPSHFRTTEPFEPL
jgi:thioredoxin-dependent peroxiredoxin